MGLLFMDGFDHCGNGGDPSTLGKWASSAGSSVTSTTVVRTGVYSLKLASSTSDLISKPLSPSGGAVVGFAINFASFSTGGDILQIREGSTVHVALAVTTGGLLVVKRGSTTLATGTTVLALTSWYYIELKTVIDDTVGTYEVHIDGVAEAALTASGVDTRNVGATGQWDRIRISTYVTANQYVDDLYVCDTSGAAPRNTFLGVCKIETLLPQTDAVAVGSNAGLTPSTGTDHGALVDENGPNTSDYNSSATVGVKDTYQYPSLSLTGTLLGIQTSLYVAKSDAGARTVCPVLRAGGTDYDGASVSPTTTFGYFTEVKAQNPNTSADWTSADITSLQAGMKIVS